MSAHRLAALKPRLARSGLSNVYPAGITHERDDQGQRLAGKIDRVLVDAPCSGLGTLRRNPDLKWRQSEVGGRADRQAGLHPDGAARLVKSGGHWSTTCSVLEAENEAIVRAFTEAHPDFRDARCAEVLERQKVEQAASLCHDGMLRLWPHRHGTDGFFAAVWRRR